MYPGDLFSQIHDPRDLRADYFVPHIEDAGELDTTIVGLRDISDPCQGGSRALIADIVV